MNLNGLTHLISSIKHNKPAKFFGYFPDVVVMVPLLLLLLLLLLLSLWSPCCKARSPLGLKHMSLLGTSDLAAQIQTNSIVVFPGLNLPDT